MAPEPRGEETDPIPVFECARTDDVPVAVALPAAWAREHGRVRVVFQRFANDHAYAEMAATDGGRILEFPWHADAVEMLRGGVPSELPDRLPADGEWNDLDQGWWAAVRAVGPDVYVAETDFDALTDVPGNPAPRLLRAGLVDVGGVEVVWSRVARAAWDHAWEVARAQCARAPDR